MSKIVYMTVNTPAYADAASRSVHCVVQFSHLQAPVPFLATADDVEPHGRQIFADCVAGKYGPVAPYAAPTNPA